MCDSLSVLRSTFYFQGGFIACAIGVLVILSWFVVDLLTCYDILQGFSLVHGWLETNG